VLMVGAWSCVGGGSGAAGLGADSASVGVLSLWSDV
jgi:hypothetical protein